MLQILKLDPSLFYCAVANLKDDDDLALLFFAVDPINVYGYLVQHGWRRGRRIYVEAFLSFPYSGHVA